VTRRSDIAVVTVSVAAWLTVVTLAQLPAETFTATASLKTGSVQASADVSVTVNRYASDEERALVVKAARAGGSSAVRKILATWKDAGFIEVGQRRVSIKYAGRRPTPSGQLVTVVTAEPIVHLGAGIPAAKPTTGFDVAVAILDVQDGGGGAGELAPAAKVGVDEGGALLIQDYGATVMFLNAIARVR
jgi:hypothetical protein